MVRRFAGLAVLVWLVGIVLVATEIAQAQADWLDGGWAYRRLVTVSNPCPEQTDYQVPVTLDSTFNFAAAQPDGRDVRLTTADGVTLLPFWIESWDPIAQTAILWVRVSSLPASGSTLLYLYYGNPDALTVSDGDTTFLLFDDQWSQFGGGGTANPVHTAGQSWWETTVSYPIVFEDNSFAPDRPRFHMLYDGHNVIGHAKGYAWSSDLVTWTEYDAGLPHPPNPNPIMGTGYAGNAPFAWGDVIKVGSTYYLYTSRGPGTIVRAESTDLITWTGFQALSGGAFGTGAAVLKEGDGITPIVVDGRYWMVYFPGSGPGSMSLASTDAAGDLLTWQPWAGNPLLAPTAGGWDASGLWTPSFVRLNDNYYIYYQGNGPAGWEIGYATAPAYDGATPIRPDDADLAWTKSDPDEDGDPDPVIRNGAGGTWDSTYCIDPVLREFDGTYYVFYTGNVANGFARSTSPEGPWVKLGEEGGPQKWVAGGTPTVSGGILTLGAVQSIRSTVTFSPTIQHHAVGYRANFPSGGRNTWGGFINGSTGDRTMIGTSSDSGFPDLYLRNMTSPSTTETRALLSGSWFGDYHVYEVLWQDGQSSAVVDHGVVTASLTLQVPSVELPVTFYNYSNTSPVSLDWVFVRKYCGADVQSEIGPEEAFRRVGVAPTNLIISEPDGADTFTLTLSSEPSAPVSIDLSTSNSECSVSPLTVTLDATNWYTGAQATVTAEDDDVDDEAQTCIVYTAEAVSDDPGYNGLNPDDVTVTVEDDDEAGVVVTPTSLSVSEPDESDTFRLTLTSQPTATVSIALSAATGECMVSPATATLDAANWSTGVTATVTAVDDDIVDGAQDCLVETGRTQSADPNYYQLNPADVAVTVQDDDEAGVVVTPTTLIVSEPDESDTFLLTLTSQPTATVSVPMTTTTGECTVSPATAVLNAANWSTGVTATVSAVDDDIIDGPQDCPVVTSLTTSADGHYQGLDPEDVAVTVEDDDEAGVVVTPTTLIVSEPDESDTFLLTLVSQPTAAVSIPMTTITGECTVWPVTATLDADNWSTGVIATVTAVDDDIVDGPQDCPVVTGLTTSADGNYQDLDPDDVAVTVDDDDWPGVVVTPTSLTVSEPDESDTFLLTLASQPTAAVSIPMTTTSGECTVSPATATLDADNWSTGVIATVTAVDDDIIDGSQDCPVVTGLTTSADGNYQDLDPDDVAVTVDDDDWPGVVVTPTSLTVSEPDESDTFLLTLASQPTAAVSIPMTTITGECTVWPVTATLDADNWSTGVIATVTAVDDDIVDGPQDCLVVTGLTTSADGNYQDLDPDDVAVTVEDDDEALWRIYLPLALRSSPMLLGVPVLHPINNPTGLGTYTTSWDAAVNAETYILEEAQDSSFAMSWQIYAGPATSYEISGRGAARYYYRVQARNSSGDGGWSNVEQVDVLWEAEPNDDALTQANGPIVSDLIYYGTFKDTADLKDYFYFELSAPHSVEVVLNNIAKWQNYDLVLRNASLQDIGYSARPGNADEHILPITLPAGRYYIQVYHFSGSGSSQPYHLRVVYE